MAVLNTAVNGRWFDGISTHPRQVSVRLVEGVWLELHDHSPMEDPAPGPDADRPSRPQPPLARFALPLARFGESWQNHPTPVQCPDGSTLWLDAAHGAVARQWANGSRQRTKDPLVARWIASWPAAVAGLVCALALIFWFDRHGAGWLAQASLPLVPTAVDKRLSKQVLASVDQRWPESRHIAQERRDRIVARFHATVRQMGVDTPLTLQFRHGLKEPAFNAFALPDGHIILLDDLTDALTDDEVMAVLGHELGHVVHRHGMQRVLRGISLVAVAGVALGDFSSVLGALAGSLQTLHYSRDDEREADAFGRRFAAAAGLPPEVWIGVWQKFRARPEVRDGESVPAWLSTHPSLEERLQEAESRARQPR